VTPDVVRATVVAFFAARLAVEGTLLAANLRSARAGGGDVPAPLRGRVSVETGRRSLDYTLARGRVAVAALGWDTALSLVLLLSGFLPALQGWVEARGLSGAPAFVTFLGVLAAVTSAAWLPLSLWSTFGVEQRFGFNRTTWRTWLVDRAKGAALAVVLGVPVLWAIWAFMTSTGPAWWAWTWAFLLAVQLLLAWAGPTLIAPLFHRFQPLPAGALRERLEALARDTSFRTRGIFVMDASRRSSHSNAYFAGVVRPRIVLFDTLLARMDVEETAAILAHEIGHFRLRHVWKRLATGALSSLAGLWILSRLVAWPPFFAAFGFASPSWGAALAILSLAGGAFTFFLAPASSWLSRRQEHAADDYSVRHARAPEALRGALVKLTGENLSNLHPHPWYAAWHHSHPTILERVERIGRAGRQEPGRRRRRPRPPPPATPRPAPTR
jgi:STE24 endopeptidase